MRHLILSFGRDFDLSHRDAYGIAGDGTTVNLPVSRSIKQHFGISASTAKGTKTCMANACMLYDVLTRLVINTNIQPPTTGEVTMLIEMMNKRIFGNAIILLDRGFGNIAICKRLMIQKVDFCIRLKTSQSNFAKLVFENPLTDFIVDWNLHRSPSDHRKVKRKPVVPIIWTQHLSKCV